MSLLLFVQFTILWEIKLLFGYEGSSGTTVVDLDDFLNEQYYGPISIGTPLQVSTVNTSLISIIILVDTSIYYLGYVFSDHEY